MTALNYSVINSASFLSSYFTVKKSEIECLIRLFCSLAERPSGKLANARLDCNTFRGILHNIFGMTDDTLMNRGKESQQTETNQPKTEPVHKTGLSLSAKLERNNPGRRVLHTVARGNVRMDFSTNHAEFCSS